VLVCPLGGVGPGPCACALKLDRSGPTARNHRKSPPNLVKLLAPAATTVKGISKTSNLPLPRSNRAAPHTRRVNMLAAPDVAADDDQIASSIRPFQRAGILKKDRLQFKGKLRDRIGRMKRPTGSKHVVPRDEFVQLTDN
jgi:hypothetical protein